MDLVVTQGYEVFNWNKYIPNEGVALVAELKRNREDNIARKKLDKIYNIWKEAKDAGRWDDERKCYLDPEENIATDPNRIDGACLCTHIIYNDFTHTLGF
ncbi:hypothetical protein Hanom_Chr00s108192g01806551 [Helianthus anomalus]